MGVYPPGSVVQLTDDRYAIVVGVNSMRPLKPRVMVHDAKVPRDEALVLDLESSPGLGIRRSIRPQQLPPASLDYLAPRPRVAYFFEPARADPRHDCMAAARRACTLPRRRARRVAGAFAEAMLDAVVAGRRRPRAAIVAANGAAGALVRPRRCRAARPRRARAARVARGRGVLERRRPRARGRASSPTPCCARPDGSIVPVLRRVSALRSTTPAARRRWRCTSSRCTTAARSCGPSASSSSACRAARHAGVDRRRHPGHRPGRPHPQLQPPLRARCGRCPTTLLRQARRRRGARLDAAQRRRPGGLHAPPGGDRRRGVLRSADVLRLRSGKVLERVVTPQCSQGQPIGRVYAFRDITEKLEAHAAHRDCFRTPTR